MLCWTFVTYPVQVTTVGDHRFSIAFSLLLPGTDHLSPRSWLPHKREHLCPVVNTVRSKYSIHFHCHQVLTPVFNIQHWYTPSISLSSSLAPVSNALHSKCFIINMAGPNCQHATLQVFHCHEVWPQLPTYYTPSISLS